MTKLSLTPGRTISAGSIGVLIFLLLFGIGFAILVGNVLIENEAPAIMNAIFYLFIIMWIGTVLFMLIYHIKNLKRQKGLSLFDITTEQNTINELNRSPMQSLRDLEAIMKDGLITETEYQQKRTEIMKEAW